MEEKQLVVDVVKALNYIIKFETESMLEIKNVELKNYFKVQRDEDEAFQREIVDLGESKGYLEKCKDVEESEIDKIKQNIL